MKLVPANKKRALIITLGIVLIGGAAFYAYRYFDQGTPGSEKYIANTLKNAETKQNLEEGNCSENTLNKLSSINESSDPKVVAQAYETRGLCHVYARDLEGGKVSYEKAAEFYEKAGNTEQAQLLRDLAKDLIQSEEPGDQPVEDSPEDAEYVQ